MLEVFAHAPNTPLNSGDNHWPGSGMPDGLPISPEAVSNEVGSRQGKTQGQVEIGSACPNPTLCATRRFPWGTAI